MEKLTEEYIYENYLEESESILYSRLPEKKRLYLTYPEHGYELTLR